MKEHKIIKLLSETMIERDPPCEYCDWNCPKLVFNKEYNYYEVCEEQTASCWVEWAEWKIKQQED